MFLSSIDPKIKPSEYGFYGFVYLIVNTINDKKYVGITTNSLQQRWRNHYWKYSNNLRSMKIARAIAKYGKEAFKIHVIGLATSKEDLEEFERIAISFYKSTDPTYGYNTSLGGMSSNQHSEETRKKIGLNTIRTLKGRKKTEEEKLKLSLSQKGRKICPIRALKHKLDMQSRFGIKVCAIDSNGNEFRFESISEACKELGLPSRMAIANVLKGKQKRYRNWTFKYAERCE